MKRCCRGEEGRERGRGDGHVEGGKDEVKVWRKGDREGKVGRKAVSKGFPYSQSAPCCDSEGEGWPG